MLQMWLLMETSADRVRLCAPGRLSRPLMASAAEAAGPVFVPQDPPLSTSANFHPSCSVWSGQFEDMHAEEFTRVGDK